jgi:6-phosphogluconolactonase
MTEKFLIGTYTKQTSEGIYEITLDTDKKQLTNLQLVAKAGNPTYVALSAANRIYSVDKGANGNGGALALNNDQRPATKINACLNEETNPAYITVDESRQFVYTANYHTGEVMVYKIESDGTLTYLNKVVHTGDVGPKPEQASGAHPHFADLTPDGKLAVVDLGQDRIYLYDISSNGELSQLFSLKMEPGFGPRHIVFDAKRHVAYVVGELSSKLAVLSYDEANTKLAVQEIVTTIPDTWNAHNGAAAIRLSHDGRFIYVSNRGHNSLAVFAVQADGSVNRIQLISSEGDFPRDFNFNQDENFVVLVNQNTNNATLYTRDAETGRLFMVQKDFVVPEGVCVTLEK